MGHRGALLAVGLIVAGFHAGTVRADLPPVAPPEKPQAQPERRPAEDSPGPYGPSNVLDRKIREGVRDEGVAPKKPEDTVDVDLLMKSIADTNQPMPSQLSRQLQQVGDFGKLSLPQKKKVVPELLALLKNETPIASEKAAEAGDGLQVRHRANAALTRLATIHFGQFPVRDPQKRLSQEDQKPDLEAGEKLIERWTKWWKEAKDEGEGGWHSVMVRTRAPLFESNDASVARTNVGFAVQQSDLTPLPLLAKQLEKANLDEVEFYTGVVDAYSQLCGLPGATTADRLVLVEFMKKHNTADVCRRTMWHRTFAIHMRRITGISLPYLEQVEQEIEENGVRRTVPVHVLKAEALQAWEDAIRKMDKKADAKEGPAARPNMNEGIFEE